MMLASGKLIFVSMNMKGPGRSPMLVVGDFFKPSNRTASQKAG
jgi:hypothetical protein